MICKFIVSVSHGKAFCGHFWEEHKPSLTAGNITDDIPVGRDNRYTLTYMPLRHTKRVQWFEWQRKVSLKEYSEPEIIAIHFSCYSLRVNNKYQTLRAKYRVVNRDPKYVNVKGSLSFDNKCLIWLTGPHKIEKLMIEN